jgi:hypothetical protein
MSCPLFLHIQSNGDVWVSNNLSDTPTGTNLAIFKINSDSKFQKLGTITASASTVASVSGGTGKQGKELA